MATRRKLDLPDDRPASFDEYGHHVDVTAEYAQGRFRKRRDWVYFALVVVFLVIPWTKFQGHQTILLDIPGRRFAFFGITFWSHDFPLVFFALGILTVGVTFMTAVWGRIWCGWACPQTVFIDFVYRRIEKWVEGNRYQRLKLAGAPMSWKKFGKRALKWLLFWLVSTNIAHSFTAYFLGAERLAGMSISSPWDYWIPFVFVSSLTVVLLFDFGWFREQFCMIMCPYGRLQSVILDSDSLAVLYDEGRGEPRKGMQPEGQSEHGDCINCYKCVAVCPTGVDIRRGIQLECVACTACIDACDAVMEQIEKSSGLIRYATENEVAGGPRRRYFRLRTVVYGLILVGLIAGLSVAVTQREIVDIKFIRAVESPYTQTKLPDGSVQIINHYKVNIKNQGFNAQKIELMLDDEAAAGVELIAPTYPLTIEGGAVVKNSIFLKFPKELTRGSGNYRMFFVIKVTSELGKTALAEEINLIGPFS
jgi:cytochrome c oxidase accessory protein FixG